MLIFLWFSLVDPTLIPLAQGMHHWKLAEPYFHNERPKRSNPCRQKTVLVPFVYLFVCFFWLNHGAKIPYIEPFRINKGCRLFSQLSLACFFCFWRLRVKVQLCPSEHYIECPCFLFICPFSIRKNTTEHTSFVILKPSRRFHLL